MALSNVTIKRGESYYQGFKLLINYLESSHFRRAVSEKEKEKIIKCFEDKANDFFNKFRVQTEAIDSYKEGDPYLTKFLKQLIYLVLWFYKGPVVKTIARDDGNSVIDYLYNAEGCRVWLAGRDVIETSFLFRKGEKEFKITQIDTPPEGKLFMDDSSISEYLKLEVELPYWFKNLPDWMQRFIKKKEKELSKRIIPSTLRSIPGPVNLSIHELQVNGETIFKRLRSAIQVPIGLLLDPLTPERDKELFRITCLNLTAQIRFCLAQYQEQKQISQRYNSTSPNRDEVVILLQSILSPGIVADVKARCFTDESDNDTLLCDLKEKAIAFFQKAIKNPHSSLGEEDVTLIKGFFSGNCYSDFLLQWLGLQFKENKFQYTDIEISRITLVSTNHPYNALRHVSNYRPKLGGNEQNTAYLLGAVARYLEDCGFVDGPEKALIEFLKKIENEKRVWSYKKELIKKIKAFSAHYGTKERSLMEALQTLLLTPKFNEFTPKIFQNFFNWFKEKKSPPTEMTLSIAEAVIVYSIGGIPCVACKSGKDRTAVAMIVSDADAISTRLNLTTEERVGLTKQLIQSGHQQALAGQNAPGSEGLINPNASLPWNVQLASTINQLSTQLGRLNKRILPLKGTLQLNDEIDRQIIHELKAWAPELEKVKQEAACENAQQFSNKGPLEEIQSKKEPFYQNIKKNLIRLLRALWKAIKRFLGLSESCTSDPTGYLRTSFSCTNTETTQDRGKSASMDSRVSFPNQEHISRSQEGVLGSSLNPSYPIATPHRQLTIENEEETSVLLSRGVEVAPGKQKDIRDNSLEKLKPDSSLSFRRKKGNYFKKQGFFSLLRSKSTVSDCPEDQNSAKRQTI